MDESRRHPPHRKGRSRTFANVVLIVRRRIWFAEPPRGKVITKFLSTLWNLRAQFSQKICKTCQPCETKMVDKNKDRWCALSVPCHEKDFFGLKSLWSLQNLRIMNSFLNDPEASLLALVLHSLSLCAQSGSERMFDVSANLHLIFIDNCGGSTL